MPTSPREFNAAAYDEVVAGDCYRLGDLNFAPTAIIDVGANVGSFTHRCKEYWPNARIVAIEPHPDNFAKLQETCGHFSDVILLNKALGLGPLFHLPGANCGGHGYLSPSVGYAWDELQVAGQPTEIQSVMLDELAGLLGNLDNLLVKIDCEAAEGILQTHEPSNEILHKAQYWTAELHFYSATTERAREDAQRRALRYLIEHGDAVMSRLAWIYRFSDTHNVLAELDVTGGHVWCRHRHRED